MTGCARYGDIRLQGNLSNTFGRVEICNSVWGTVCQDNWSNSNNARVACRQLGFSAEGARTVYSGFTNGNWLIWLDDVQCSGDESRLIDCPANSMHNCQHWQDVGVSCVPIGELKLP